jgi:hypothetical protein
MRLIARADDGAMAFDARGNHYENLEGVPDSLPELFGWSPHHRAVWKTAFRVLDIVQSAQPNLFAAARVSGPPLKGTLSVYTRDDELLVRIPCPADRDLKDRLAYLPVVLADVRSHSEVPTSADLRWANQIVIGYDQESADK